MKSVEQYRLYDLVTLAVLGIILDIMCMKFTNGLISFGLALSMIAIIRWGWRGLLVAASSGIGQVIGIQLIVPSWSSLLYEIFLYVFGNLGIVLAYVCMPKINKKNSKKTFEILLLYAIISYIGQSFCRCFVTVIYVNDFTNYFDSVYELIGMHQVQLVGTSNMYLRVLSSGFVVGLVGNFLMPLLVAAVVLMIVNRIDGILVDPIDYLIQQRNEAKRSYEVFEGLNLPEEVNNKSDETQQIKQDKDVDNDE